MISSPKARSLSELFRIFRSCLRGLPRSVSAMKCIRIYRAELRQDRAAYLAFKAAEQGDTTKHDRYKRYAARLGRVLGDGGDPWREGPREGAIRRLEAKRKAREGVEA